MSRRLDQKLLGAPAHPRDDHRQSHHRPNEEVRERPLVAWASGETEIHMRGGLLGVRRGANDCFQLLGEARHHGQIELAELEPLARGRGEG